MAQQSKQPFIAGGVVVIAFFMCVAVLFAVSSGGSGDSDATPYQQALFEYEAALHTHQMEINEWKNLRAVNSTSEETAQAANKVEEAKRRLIRARESLRQFN